MYIFSWVYTQYFLNLFFSQVHHQLQKMGSLVKEMGEIVARETRYVENMPLTTFLQEDTETLLAEANSLIECQV